MVPSLMPVDADDAPAVAKRREIRMMGARLKPIAGRFILLVTLSWLQPFGNHSEKSGRVLHQAGCGWTGHVSSRYQSPIEAITPATDFSNVNTLAILPVFQSAFAMETKAFPPFVLRRFEPVESAAGGISLREVGGERSPEKPKTNVRQTGQGDVTLARRNPLPVRPFEPSRLKLRYS